MREFYEVLDNGVIYRYTKFKKDEYRYTCLTKHNEDDTWELTFDNKPSCLISLISEASIKHQIRLGNYFKTLEEAIIVSQKRWEEAFAPNALWKVIKVFDNIQVTDFTAPLPRKDAKRIFNQCVNHLHTSYKLVKV